MISANSARALESPWMSERHIQLISQLEKSHKKLGIVLICSVGTLRTASGRRGETTRASVAAGLTYRKSGKLGHVGKTRRADSQAAR